MPCIGAYDSYYLQGVVGVFMLLFGVNFNIYYLLLARDFKLVFKNEELRFYIITVLVSVTVIAINIRSMFSSWFDCFSSQLLPGFVDYHDNRICYH